MLLALVGGMTFVALEIGMILLDPYLPHQFYIYDEDLGFRVKPGANNSNSYGFNDDDYAPEAEPGVTRIMVLSDSYNCSGGREGNCTSLLRKRMQSAWGTNRVQVVNAGFPGTHTGDQLAMLELFGFPYSPDIVILGFFLGNDFAEAYPHRKRLNVNSIFFDVDRRNERSFLGQPFVQTSRLWALIRQRYGYICTDLRRRRYKTDCEFTFSRRDFIAIEEAHIESFMHGFEQDERCMYALASVSRMAEAMKEWGAEFHVAIYPTEFQVDESLYAEVLQAKGIGEEDADPELPNKLLIAHLRKEGIPYIDLTTAFKEAGRKERLYLQQDTHWNEAGNRLAADLLYEYVEALVARSRLILE